MPSGPTDGAVEKLGVIANGCHRGAKPASFEPKPYAGHIGAFHQARRIAGYRPVDGNRTGEAKFLGVDQSIERPADNLAPCPIILAHRQTDGLLGDQFG